MSRVLIIAKREVRSLFVSPIAYVVLFLFLAFMGIVFMLPIARIFVPGGVIELRELTNFTRFALFFVMPLLTMSIFSDEYKSGRIEMLRTSPITEFDLVLGKFLGAMVYYLVLVGSTLLYLAILWAFGKPDLGQVLSCYLGMALMGCMFVAVGLFYSACTSDQIVAALSGIITLGILTITQYLAPFLPREWSLGKLTIPIRGAAEYLTVGTHIGDFARGSVELGNVVYFLGFAGLFLFWTYLVLESRKWR
jgi:ABC-2 type transport system permease protein